MTAFSVVHVLWFSAVALAIAGSMDVVSTVLRVTILQLAITDEFRGRIQSIQMSVVTGGPSGTKTFNENAARPRTCAHWSPRPTDHTPRQLNDPEYCAPSH